MLLLLRAALELPRSWFLFGAELRVSLFAGLLRGCYRANQYIAPPPDRATLHLSPCPFWTKPITHVGFLRANDDSDVSSIAYSYPALLDGVPGWVPSYRLSFPLHGLMVSRYRGESASPLASRGQELHLHREPSYQRPFGLSPQSLAHGHFWGTCRTYWFTFKKGASLWSAATCRRFCL
jgi:hypothetical protein